MKKLAAIVLALTFTAALLPTAVFACGGRHRGTSTTNYTYCPVQDCTITSTHNHDGRSYYAHHNEDGHTYHTSGRHH